MLDLELPQPGASLPCHHKVASGCHWVVDEGLGWLFNCDEGVEEADFSGNVGIEQVYLVTEVLPFLGADGHDASWDKDWEDRWGCHLCWSEGVLEEVLFKGGAE